MGKLVTAYTFPAADAYTLSSLATQFLSSVTWASLLGGSTANGNSVTLPGNGQARSLQGFGAAAGPVRAVVEWTVADLNSHYVLGVPAGATDATNYTGVGLGLRQEQNAIQPYNGTAVNYADRFSVAVGDVLRIQVEDSQEASLGANSTRLSYYKNGVKFASYHSAFPAIKPQIVVAALSASQLNNVTQYAANPQGA